MAAVFWVSAAMLVYSFVGYGVLLLALSRLKPARPQPPDWAPPKVSFLIAAHNEAAVIGDKIENTLALDAGGAEIEVIVVSDGSTDGTGAIARSVADARVTVLEPGRIGKAAALGVGLKQCTGTVVVLSDANAVLADGAVTAMLRHFSDPGIGGVCGQITVESEGRRNRGIGFSESLFWRYDQWLKQAESRLGGTVSAQGSVYALRRELAVPPEPGFADDFVMSVGVVAAGSRLVFEPQARTVEIVTETLGNEMRRRIRAAEHSWRSLLHHAGLMNPLRHGWYAWQLVSHKLVRRLNPAFLVVLLVSNLALLGEHWVYTLTGIGQITFYALALLALLKPGLRRFKPAAVASFFVFAHAAVALGLFRYATGRKSVLWTPARSDA